MSAEHLLPSGSPADFGIDHIHWIDQPGRFIQIGNLRVRLTPDWAVILEILLEKPGFVRTYDRLLNGLYLDQRRPEPETALNSLANKVCHMRRLGLVIEGVTDAGYILWGVREEFLELEGAGT